MVVKWSRCVVIITTLCGCGCFEVVVDGEGNVVLGYTSDSQLMLDCDLKREVEVKKFAREYTKFHDLGSSAAFKTSDTTQVDLLGNRLIDACIVFGRVPLAFDEIEWHVKEAFRLGMVNKGFAALRKFGFITIRVNSKNSKIPPPKPLFYFNNGEDTGNHGVYRPLDYVQKDGEIIFTRKTTRA